MITKSGTNKMHGAGFEFLRNDHLDSRNFFDLTAGRSNAISLEARWVVPF